MFLPERTKSTWTTSSRAAKWSLGFQTGSMTGKREEKITMKRVCAWCEIVMESPAGDSDQVTHGICPACFDSLIAKVGAASGEHRDRDGNANELKS